LRRWRPIGVRVEEFFEIPHGDPPISANPDGAHVTGPDQTPKSGLAQFQKTRSLLQGQ
jgi:hypothetical protein